MSEGGGRTKARTNAYGVVDLNGELDAALGKLAAQVAGDAEDLARLVLKLLLGDEEDA